MLKFEQQKTNFIHSYDTSNKVTASSTIHEEEEQQTMEVENNANGFGKPLREVQQNGVSMNGVRSKSAKKLVGNLKVVNSSFPEVSSLNRRRTPSVKFDTLNSAPKEQLNKRTTKSNGQADQNDGHLGKQRDQNSRDDNANEEEQESADKKQDSDERKQPPGGSAGDDDNQVTSAQGDSDDENKPFSAPLVWRNIILFIILHSIIPVGIRMLWLGQVSLLLMIWTLICVYSSGVGVTGGAHRLWSHRSYKASWSVQILLMMLQTMSGQNSIYTWSRDHRVHHKYSETNADPHNIKRGFFFAHMGWLCCRKHPDVKVKGAVIDMSDLEANPVVMFQHRHFWWMSVLLTVLVPSYIPVLLWGENFWVSFTFAFMVRYLITLHGTWLVNSAAHYFGSRPYDEHIEARESPFVIAAGLGEGFHNYHHTFPYDYSTSEFGKYFNITTTFIDACAALGLVTDRRTTSADLIAKRRQRTGDGSGSKQQEQESASQLTTSSPSGDGNRSLVNNLIHELPYISGLTSMKYTM